MLNKFRLATAWIFSHAIDKRKVDPKSYVGTDEISGQLQLELLKREGCRPTSKVLEIGCGHLHLGVPLIEYLDSGNYVGIDPNEWLREDAMKQEPISQLVKKKNARFLSTQTFDASETGIRFDFVFSHSVLSHCAHWQLGRFLRNTTAVLAPGGRIVASIRLAEGNAFGSPGRPDKSDSRNAEWVYPGVSWFRLNTVKDSAKRWGLTTVHRPDYTEFYTRTRPNEFHDWLVFHL